MLIRLQKFLAEAEVASRRKAEEIIIQGRVSVNGEVIDTLGVKIDDEKDMVCVDGKPVKRNESFIYIMLNKPVGCVTTVADQFNRNTVMDYIKDIDERVYPVGRLDYNTSGLLLLTNDGELTNRLTHPRHRVQKTYIASVKNAPSEEAMERFRRGLKIDTYITAPAEIEIMKNGGGNKLTYLEIKIREGKNRQVRKMCAAVGTPVITLKRVAIGSLTLGTLEEGKYRFLNEEEIEYIKGL